MFRSIDTDSLGSVIGGEGPQLPTQLFGEKVECIPTGTPGRAFYTGFPDLSAPGINNGAQDAYCVSTKTGHSWNIRRTS